MELRKGMRVKATRPVGPFDAKEQEGVILMVRESSTCVQFDNHISGHDGSSENLYGKVGHCWFVINKYLEPIIPTDNNEASHLLKEGL